MKNFSITGKINLFILFGLTMVVMILSIFVFYQSKSSLIELELQKLKSVNVGKNQEITDYFNSLGNLLVSIASNTSTKDSFQDFENGFYKLQEELNLDVSSIKEELKEDFKNNYLASVSYDLPEVEPKKAIEKYLPQDINALIAQYIFITNNNSAIGEKNKLTYNPSYSSTYMNAHKKYHESFDKILNSFNLYDIFMVDLKGNLIYTDFKEKDYATNLKNGPYSNSGIADAYKKALDLDEGKIAFSDFKPYEASYNSPASFIATPIFINKVKKGVLIFQMPIDMINTIMSYHGNYKNAGLGDSGEVYLIGSDYKMRNNSRFTKDIADPIIKKMQTTIGLLEVKTDSTKAVIQSNKSGQWIINDYRGVSVLSVYDEIELYGQNKWAIISEIDEEEAMSSVYELRNFIILISLVIAVFAVILGTFFMKFIVKKPLEVLNDGIQNLIITKDVDARIEIKSKDEIGQISQSFNSYLQSIQDDINIDQEAIIQARKVMGKVSVGLYNDRIHVRASSKVVNRMIDSINEMIETSQKNMQVISDALNHLSKAEYNFEIPRLQGVTGLVASLLDGTRVVQSTSSEVMALIDNSNKRLTFQAKDMAEAASELSTSANEQAVALEETAAAIEEVTSTIESNNENAAKMTSFAKNVSDSSRSGVELANKTSTSMDELSDEVTTIHEAITVIDQIAFQTNILSLNAAVEAATAGEAGKGFAVVAQEVRNLAARSAEAANEIKTLVESATNKAKQGKEVSSQMIEGFKGLDENINETMELIDDVSNATREQKEAMVQINETVNSLDRETQKNAAQAANISDMAKLTTQLAEQLQEAVDRTSFNPDAKRRVCDSNMIFDLNKLKTDHITFKQTNFSCCKAGDKFAVKDHTQCDMGKWIIANENSDFAQTEAWERLKEEHRLVHHMVKDIVDLYADEYENAQILSVTENLEKHVIEVFHTIDEIKEFNCDLQFKKRKGEA